MHPLSSLVVCMKHSNHALLMAELCTAPSSLHAKHLTYDCVKGGGACLHAGVPFLPLFKTPLIYRQPWDIPPKTK